MKEYYLVFKKREFRVDGSVKREKEFTVKLDKTSLACSYALDFAFDWDYNSEYEYESIDYVSNADFAAYILNNFDKLDINWVARAVRSLFSYHYRKPYTDLVSVTEGGITRYSEEEYVRRKPYKFIRPALFDNYFRQLHCMYYDFRIAYREVGELKYL